MAKSKKKIGVRATPKTAQRTAGAVKRTKAVNPKSPLTVLRAARKLLSARKRWTQGAHARDSNGMHIELNDKGAFTKPPVCWCADGALIQAAGSSQKAVYGDARRELSFTTSGDYGVWTYNDADRRTHKQILAWFDRAIERASKAES